MNNKKLNITYWIVTGIFAAYMLFTSIGHVTNNPDAVKFIVDLGFPAYIVQFIGIAKILGIIAILIPGFPRVKDWAYAGLLFDLIGATYAVVATYGLNALTVIFMGSTIAMLFWSYYLMTKKYPLVAKQA